MSDTTTAPETKHSIFTQMMLNAKAAKEARANDSEETSPETKDARKRLLKRAAVAAAVVGTAAIVAIKLLSNNEEIEESEDEEVVETTDTDTTPDEN